MNNRTVDDYQLDDTFRLRFTPLSFSLEKSAAFSIGLAVEHNESCGKRKPYLIGWIGRLTVQSGWLFDSEAKCQTE